MLVYNAVAIACMVWMYLAFKDAPPADLGGAGEVGWAVATILTLPALALFLGAMTPRNPAMPTPGAEAAARAGPAGAFLVTRHPMMWGFALWAMSHIVLWWSTRTLIVAGAILVLALVGARLQDAKKRGQMGDAWLAWEAETSFVPRLSNLGALGWKGWLAALLAWGVLMWVHLPLGGIGGCVSLGMTVPQRSCRTTKTQLGNWDRCSISASRPPWILGQVHQRLSVLRHFQRGVVATERPCT